jgi:hypothetical protein
LLRRRGRRRQRERRGDQGFLKRHFNPPRKKIF